MNNSQFPEATFREGLKITKKIKSSMKPFIEEFSKLNMHWIFESFRILISNLVDPTLDPLIKMNSMFATKCIMDTAEYIPIALIEAYALPIIANVAAYAPAEKEDERGSEYFLKGKNNPDEALLSYGFNYVKLSYQILHVAAVMKPKKLYYTDETADPSDFARQMAQVKKSLKHPPQTMTFYKQQPSKYYELFQKNLAKFDDKQAEAYARFLETVFLAQIKQNFNGSQYLDIRQLYKSGDFFICQDALSISEQMIIKGKNVKNAQTGLNYITEMIQAGVFQTWLWSHDNSAIQSLVKQVDNCGGNKHLARGQNFLPQKNGTPEQKKHFYMNFLQSLEFWAHSYLKNSLAKPSEESNLRKYYRYLKDVQGYEFPLNPLLSKDIKLCEENFRLSPERNKLVIEQLSEAGELTVEKSNAFTEAVERGKPPAGSKKSIASNGGVNEPSQSASASKVSSNQNIESRQTIQKKEVLQVQSVQKISQIKPEKQGQKSKEVIASEKKVEAVIQEKTVIQEKAVEERHSSQKLMDQKSIKKEAVPTPGGRDDSMSETSVANLEAFRERLDKCERLVSQLHLSEKNLPKNMSYLKGQKQKLEQCIETIQVNQDDLEYIMGRYFDLQARITEIEPVYERYKRSQIDFETFASILAPSKSSKKVSPRGNVSSQDKISIQQAVEVQARSNKVIVPQEKKQVSEKSFRVVQNQLESASIGHRTIEKASEKDVKFNQSQKSVSEQSQKYQKQDYLKVPESPILSNLKVDVSQHWQQENKASLNSGKKRNYEDEDEIRISHLKGEEVAVEAEPMRVNTFRKFNDKRFGEGIPSRAAISNIGSNHQIGPITYIMKEDKENSAHMSGSIYEDLKSSGSRKVYGHLPDKSREEIDIPEILDDDEFIECPSLDPLENSFHEQEEAAERFRKKPKSSFKDAFSNNDFIMKGTKKENMFWLKTDATSIIKPSGQSQKRSRIESVISVPELLEEKNRKYESQIKEIEDSRNRKILDLQTKLQRAEREKNSISNELKAKESEIRTIRQQSEQDGRSRISIEQVNYIDDQNYMMKKLEAAHGSHSKSFTPSHRKKDFEKASQYENLTSSCMIINTKNYSEYFKKFSKEKEKKMHLKNKELLHKDDEIQIGCMGYREGNSYKITCYLTPEADIKLVKIGLEHDENLKIEHDAKNGVKVAKKQQEKLHFLVDVCDVPYHIPYLYIHYTIKDQDRKVRTFLPCGFHKFFKIDQADESIFKGLFEKDPATVQRGEQIPYSKRALKNLDNILDYLPHIAKLNNGLTDGHGELCYGGIATYKKSSFPLKICVKPNQFLYIRTINQNRKSDQQRLLDFYVATLNHFLMKDIVWEE